MEKTCEQLRRRILCFRMGKATFVDRPEDVDEANGKFLKIPQDELTAFFDNRVVATVLLQDYCFRFFVENPVSSCLRYINDPSLVSDELVSDRNWLAMRLSGGTGMPEDMDDGTSANEIVRVVHKNTPMKPVIKSYLINKIANLPGSVGPTRKGSLTIIACKGFFLNLLFEMLAIYLSS